MPLVLPSFRLLLLAAAAFLFWCLLSSSNHRPALQWRIREQVDNVLDQTASDLVRSFQTNRSNSEALDVLGIQEIQDSLACYVQQASWSGQNFSPNVQCLPDGRRLTSPVLSLCSVLRAKKVLLVGPQATFHLHTLWLHSLSERFNTSSKCIGADFCTFHHICVNGTVESSLRTPRSRKPPTFREISTYGSAILRFVHSTTLHASDDSYDRFYTTPIVDTQTHIRVKNAFWMNHARNSDLIVMNRGPLPAPASTYSFSNDAVSGNWTFVDELYATPSTRYLTFADDQSMVSCMHYRRYQRAIHIVNAALHATLTVFLPGVLEALTAIQKSSTILSKVLVWHGSWYLHPVCTSHGSPEGFSTEPQLLSQDDDSDVDPWSLYHNAQVYMQDRLLPQLLPHFGIVYLPLSIPFAPANVTYKGAMNDGGTRLFDDERKDCIRYPLGEPEGRALELAFLGGLVKLVEQIQ